jgi:hypothetical protein
MGRMGPMVMGLWDEGTNLWGTMGQWRLMVRCYKTETENMAVCATFKLPAGRSSLYLPASFEAPQAEGIGSSLLVGD